MDSLSVVCSGPIHTTAFSKVLSTFSLSTKTNRSARLHDRFDAFSTVPTQG